MRALWLTLAISSLPLFGLSVQQADGCPGVEKAMKKYIAENLSDDEEKPRQLEQKFIRISPNVSAVQVMLPDPDEGRGKTQPAVFFFAGKRNCEFVFQAEGELTEILAAGVTRYVFVRHETREGDENHVDYQVLTVRAGGEVTATHDQNGQEIFIEESLQKRCEGKVGSLTQWFRDENDAAKITLRQRHTERDEKCRITEDTSSYRYYRLAADHWHLDEGEVETAAEDTGTPQCHPQNAPTHSPPVASPPSVVNRR